MRESQLLTSENFKENLEAGIEYAKEAVKIDSNDGESWAILGNAYLSLFFKNQDDKLLKKSIISFDKAVSCFITSPNISLTSNRFKRSFNFVLFIIYI